MAYEENRNLDVHAVRVGVTGAPLDAAPIVIAATPENENAPEVASDGSQFVVAWATHTIGVYARRVASD